MYITKNTKNKNEHKFVKDNKIYQLKDNEIITTDEYNMNYTIDLKIVRRLR